MEQAEQKEIKKEPEVDLDLDGVQETQIDLDDKVEDKHPSEIKKEELDPKINIKKKYNYSWKKEKHNQTHKKCRKVSKTVSWLFGTDSK